MDRTTSSSHSGHDIDGIRAQNDPSYVNEKVKRLERRCEKLENTCQHLAFTVRCLVGDLSEHDSIDEVDAQILMGYLSALTQEFYDGEDTV